MPFQSEAQRRWMHAEKPDMAKRWEAETPPGPLPEHVGGPKHLIHAPHASNPRPGGKR